MSLTAHNRFFGWVDGLKFNQNTSMFNPSPSTPRPFPAIIENPTYKHVYSNWNRADTGAVLSFLTLGLLMSSRIVLKQTNITSMFAKRYNYYRYVNLFLMLGIYLGSRNSYYRLIGLVPNGLESTQEAELVKYDYTSEIVKNSGWKYIFGLQRQPSSWLFEEMEFKWVFTLIALEIEDKSILIILDLGVNHVKVILTELCL